NLFARACGPDHYGPVLIGRGEKSAVRAECLAARSGLSGSLERSLSFAGRCVPELDPPITTWQRESLPIRTKETYARPSRPRTTVRGFLECTDSLTTRRVPDCPAVVASMEAKELSVGAKKSVTPSTRDPEQFLVSLAVQYFRCNVSIRGRLSDRYPLPVAA